MPVGWPSAQTAPRRLTTQMDAPRRPPDFAPDSHSVRPPARLTALTGWLGRWGFAWYRYRLVGSALALLPIPHEGGRGSDSPVETAGNGAERGPAANAQ